MKNILKLIKLCSIVTCFMFVISSCQSTSQEVTNDTQVDKSVEKKEETVNKSKFNFDNVDISLVSSANIPFANTEFKTPFVVSVKDKEGNPLSNYTLSVTYPISRVDNVINFTTVDMNTDANGILTFKPEPFATSVNSKIVFAPKANNSIQEKAAKEVQLEVPFKVKFRIVKKGIVINLIDYSESDKMILNSSLSTSSNLVGEFWRAGYTSAQNADFHKVIDQGSNAVYLAAKKLFQGSTYFKYIIYGKIKYASKIEKVEGGVSLSLTGTATVIDYTTGKETVTVTKTVSVVDKNEWNVLKACQTKLAKELLNELIYSM